MADLHRRLSALLALISIAAFVSGAGLDALSVVPAGVLLLAAMFLRPAPHATRALEPVWRGLALVLAARAAFVVLTGGADPVIAMVDLLMLLLCAESLRERDGSGDARHFALTFALLIASAAYRPGPLFAPLFAAYIVCATVALVLGHLTRQADRHGQPATLPDGTFVARVALLSGTVLLMSAAVFLFFPRVSQGWAARTPSPTVRSVVGFADRVSLGAHGARIEPNPDVVLRIEFPDGAPPAAQRLHWRGRSYNRFDGVTWSRAGRIETPGLEARWSGAHIVQLIYARPLGDANVIFGLHPILDVTPQSRIRPIPLSTGDYGYAGSADPVYRVRSGSQAPPAPRLRAAGTAYPPALLAYLQLPPLTNRIVALADSFRAAYDNPHDLTRAVELWLSTTFDYTLDLPATRREATLDHFLFVRRAGHCEYFSTALAIILRSAGIPARNVNGFLGGEWNEFGRFLTVTQNQAHSWVEVFFPDYGWVTFDPTPAAAALATSSGFGRFRPLFRFFDGVSHRWSKWVLDYDIRTQVSLLGRFKEPLSAEPAAEAPAARRGWLILLVAVLVFVLVRAARRLDLERMRPVHAVSRDYSALRRVYARAGVAAEHHGPLAFAEAVAGAPGAAAVRAFVQRYVRIRFAGEAPDAAEVRTLRELARAARGELRRFGSVDQRVAG